MAQKPMLRAEVGMRNARALRNQSKRGVIHEGEGHWPKFSQKMLPGRPGGLFLLVFKSFPPSGGGSENCKKGGPETKKDMRP